MACKEFHPIYTTTIRNCVHIIRACEATILKYSICFAYWPFATSYIYNYPIFGIHILSGKNFRKKDDLLAFVIYIVMKPINTFEKHCCRVEWVTCVLSVVMCNIKDRMFALK